MYVKPANDALDFLKADRGLLKFYYRNGSPSRRRPNSPALNCLCDDPQLTFRKGLCTMNPTSPSNTLGRITSPPLPRPISLPWQTDRVSLASCRPYISVHRCSTLRPPWSAPNQAETRRLARLTCHQLLFLRIAALLSAQEGRSSDSIRLRF